MCEAVREIKEKVGVSVCVPFGLLNEEQFRKLKEAGVTRVYNNLETSRRNFPSICAGLCCLLQGCNEWKQTAAGWQPDSRRCLAGENDVRARTADGRKWIVCLRTLNVYAANISMSRRKERAA